jgi:plastocyanin
MWRTRPFLLLELALLASIACVLIACGGDDADPPARDRASEDLVNGCDRNETPLSRDTDIVEIRFGGLIGYAYEPACVRVKAGTRVRFVGPFGSHPLAAGRVHADEVVAEPKSRFKSTWEGETATFVLPHAGTVGYYCDQHVLEGMFGAVFVE